jgi:quercetin dioxygenase-like cupin family protein
LTRSRGSCWDGQPAPAAAAPRNRHGGHEKVLRQTVIAMVKDAALTEHANPGEASVYVLRGRVVLAAGG